MRPPSPPVVLSSQGSDRATAYVMSNKILTLPEGVLCTWIDHQRQNQWALVDRTNGRILRSGPLGAVCTDNHCGAALTLAQGIVHAVTGGHHGPFHHYRLASLSTGQWDPVGTLDVPGTYPGLCADSCGDLHLVFRSSGERWTLDYSRFEDGRWSKPRALVRAEKPGYIYWTNGLAPGPDGTLHLLLGNTRVQEEGALLYSASHLMSRDAGETWRTFTGDSLVLPVSTTTLPLLTPETCPERTQTRATQQEQAAQGPNNLNYHQLLLSNPVVDARGNVHGVLHNTLTGTADLISGRDGVWTVLPLTEAATGGNPSLHIHSQSALSLGPDGRLVAVLMIRPAAGNLWGAPGTFLSRLEMDTDHTGLTIRCLTPPDPGLAQWLPALEHPQSPAPQHAPALLFTRGVNAGGFAQNVNALRAEVCFSPG